MKPSSANNELAEGVAGSGGFLLDVGLEVHAELKTETKIFCGCSTRFGAPANSQVCPVCLGLPGVLPVLNRKAVELGLRVALACKAEILRPSIFERKNYYYPDLPKNYQISQKRTPLGRNGHLDLWLNGVWWGIRIPDVHLEEDAGKLLHPDACPSRSSAARDAAGHSLVDYNRAGVPLLEIISAPDLHRLEEVQAYMEAIRDLLLYVDASDCRMEEGSLRFEANISLRPAGSEELGRRVEIKNLNSFRSVLGCLEYEMKRHQEVLSRGEPVAQETRLWDDARGVSEAMRSKEEAHDYRYFPEPDLVPLRIDDDWIARIGAGLPELRDPRRRRFVEQIGLSEYDAEVLSGDKALANFFEQALSDPDLPALPDRAKLLANWITGDLIRRLRTLDVPVEESKVTPSHLAQLISLIGKATISTTGGKQVLSLMFETGKKAEQIVQELGLAQVSDEAELAKLVDEVLAEHADAVESYCKGNQKSLGFLVGQAMRKSKGRANPQLLNRLMKERLARR